ncbi:sulfotransferase family 2 domain-containing protein [Gilvimarinus xylanilyticus]|uniref:Sulfotransferase family protein n=1 Tax=Gilvimarinus xylanilyticus TaxID=2944139 RepID=A0A9X2HYY9_9GAMM|nr:sulfotransferase family 2 domain-containing protein [Gilvimarinus xylanilyticus]MCP8900274.1 sulfotransferase family protein [Gilvimarinus xylanilyticus]
MQPLFFVHIPKTAGTSFRRAAEKRFGAKRVWSDYGKHKIETSKKVVQYTHHERDYYSLYQAMERDGARMLGGHVPALRYVAGLGVTHTVSFFRDPIQRIASAYSHYVRHKAFEGDFREFYTAKGRINLQSRLFENVPIEAVGVIGLTEAYEQSLDIINDRYDLKLKPLRDNVGRSNIAKPYHIIPEELAELEQLNRKDIALYQQVKTLFEQRRALLAAGRPYAHGRIVALRANRVVGWAWWAGDNRQPVPIQVKLNGRVVAEDTARILRPHMCRLKVPRDGYVEFKIPIEAKAGDTVECVVADTGQSLSSRPMTVPAGN